VKHGVPIPQDHEPAAGRTPERKQDRRLHQRRRQGGDFNFGKGGRATTTLGVPGSGISHCQSVSPGKIGSWVDIVVVVVACAAASAAFRLL
jgi:hypothetical protein